jgi:hypothetical protein
MVAARISKKAMMRLWMLHKAEGQALHTVSKGYKKGHIKQHPEEHILLGLVDVIVHPAGQG